MTSSSKLRGALVMSEEDQGTFAIHIQSPLQSCKQRHQRLSEARDGSTLVRNEVTAASKEKLQLGDLLLPCPKLAEV